MTEFNLGWLNGLVGPGLIEHLMKLSFACAPIVYIYEKSQLQNVCPNMSVTSSEAMGACDVVRAGR